MLFRNRLLPHNLPVVSIDDKVVVRVNPSKFLGIVIDEHLNWKEYISQIYISLCKTCGVLYRTWHKLSIEAMIILYYTLCHSKIVYCIGICGCS